MVVLQAENLTKKYSIYKRKEDRLWEFLVPFCKRHQEFFALKEVSLSILAGESVGIIGENGAGKSTLLKILSGVQKPDGGRIKVSGKIMALLELGIGFDEEKTGRENIRINGLLLGYRQEELEAKTKDILAFAEIGDFIDQPVKTYSSGMIVRLAFAVAVSTEPEILMIDEALAVGDIYFQAKCFHKLEELQEKGTTLIFVSHDLSSVKRLCSRAIWISQGEIRMDGEAGIVCENYLADQIERKNQEIPAGDKQFTSKRQSLYEISRENREKKILCVPLPKKKYAISGTGKAKIVSAYFQDLSGIAVNTLVAEKEYRYCMIVYFEETMEHPLFGVELETEKGIRVYGVNNDMLELPLEKAERQKYYFVSFQFRLPRFHRGDYLVTPAVASGTHWKHTVHQRLHNFDVVTIEGPGFDEALIELDAAFRIQECKKEQFC